MTTTTNLGLTKDDPSELYSVERVNANSDRIDDFAGTAQVHMESADNPHGVTASQIGAATAEALTAHIGDATAHVTAEERAAWDAKQDALTTDSAVTEGSTNPVQSGAVKAYVDSGFLPLSGGAMTDGATLSLSSSDAKRRTVLRGGSLQHHAPAADGWGMGMTFYNADGTNRLGGIGAHGIAGELSYIYIGGSYDDPLIKILPTGKIFLYGDAEDLSSKIAALEARIAALEGGSA